MTWHPMETAPKDGTEFWGLCKGDAITMFWHPERRPAFRRAPHHPHKVRMHPGQAQFAASGDHRATPRSFSNVRKPPMPSMASTSSNR